MGVTSAAICLAAEADWPRVWALFQSVAAGGEVFAYDESTTEAIARKLWFDAPAVCYVCEAEGRFAGTYYVRPNQPGRGDHVANAGYMVDPAFRGRAPHASQVLEPLSVAPKRRGNCSSGVLPGRWVTPDSGPLCQGRQANADGHYDNDGTAAPGASFLRDKLRADASGAFAFAPSCRAVI